MIISSNPAEPVEPADTVPTEKSICLARDLFAELGISCDDESTSETPRRFVKAIQQLTGGSRLEPDRHLSVTFPPPPGDAAMVYLTRIPFTSLCEHHLLPFTGHVSVAYLTVPGARIVGLSKLARLVREYAARPQMQERLGNQVVDAIGRRLDVRGAACEIRATHACTTLRGAQAYESEMVTTHLRGVFEHDSLIRTEFLTRARAKTT